MPESLHGNDALRLIVITYHGVVPFHDTSRRGVHVLQLTRVVYHTSITVLCQASAHFRNHEIRRHHFSWTGSSPRALDRDRRGCEYIHRLCEILNVTLSDV